MQSTTPNFLIICFTGLYWASQTINSNAKFKMEIYSILQFLLLLKNRHMNEFLSIQCTWIDCFRMEWTTGKSKVWDIYLHGSRLAAVEAAFWVGRFAITNEVGWHHSKKINKQKSAGISDYFQRLSCLFSCKADSALKKWVLPCYHNLVSKPYKSLTGRLRQLLVMYLSPKIENKAV